MESTSWTGRTAVRIRPGIWKLAGLVLLAAGQSGCNAVLLLGYLIGGPPSQEAPFHTRTKESLEKKNKVTLVYCYAPKELKWDNEAVDYELAKHIAHQLNSNKIKVIDPDRVNAWLDRNDKWHKVSEIGAAFKVDYVIHVDLKDYSLFEAHSANLYRGRADAIVSVVKMNEDKKDGHVIFNEPIKSNFPTRAPVDSNQVSFAEFKKRYLSALSDEIGRLFYPSFSGDDIPYGVMN